MVASTRARVAVGVLVLLVLASIGTYAFISAQKPAAASAAATLTIYKGTAQRAPAGSNTFSPVLSGQGLNGGDQVRTGAATAAAIRFGDGSITRLDSNTTITVKTLTHQGSEYQTSFAQSAGKTWNRVQRLVGLAKFNVTGPNSSTAEVRGTTFVLIIEPNGDVRIDDYQGTVIFHGKAGSVTVTTGQSSTILNGTSTPQPATGIPTADLQDPFTVFNIAADANLDATGNGSILSVNANNSIAVAETQGAFVGGAADGNSDLSFTLDWPGSTFELAIIDPDGVEYDSVVSDQHPVTYTVPKPRAGDWGYRVHDVSSEKPKENWSVVVGAIRPAKKTPNLFFRGGSNQVCDHTVIGGQTDTWSLNARDAAGAPALTSSKLPDYGTFTSSKGTGTFKFTPPLDVAPVDIAITVTAVFAGDTAPITCTEHVIPPKDASVGGSVVSGSSGVSGVQVTLTMPDSSTQIAFSDGAGNFGFSGLGAGDFTLAMTVPNGYKAGGPTSQTVTLDGKTAGTPVTFNLVPFAISLASLPNGSVGDPSCSVLGLINGVPPISWSVSSGAMPTGSGFDAYGHCNGTPTSAGTFNFTLSATDANGDTASHGYTVTIFPAPSINGPGPAIAPIDNLRPWDVGFANPQTLTGTGGIVPYSWSVVSGVLPAGMSLTAGTGTINGAPQSGSVNPGTYSVGVQLTDAAGAKAYRVLHLSVTPAPIFQNTTLADVLASGDSYSRRLGFTADNGPFTVTTTGLPVGITATVVGTQPAQCDCSDPTRVELNGSPSTRGAYRPVITVHDSVGGSATLRGSIDVVSPGVSILQSTLPAATLNVSYSASITPTGGLGGPYTMYATSNLPTGLSFTPAAGGLGPATLSGTPAECGTFPLDFVVYDNSSSNSATLTLDVGAAQPTICSPAGGALPGSDVGVSGYSVPLVAAGGTGPYSWAVSGGPPDLVVSGSTLTTTAAGFAAGDINPNGGPWNLSLVATDSLATASASVAYQLTISPAPVLTTRPGQLPNATGAGFYQQAFTVTGNPPTGLALATNSGPLPDGLFLTQSNQCLPAGPCLEGSPAQVGTFNFSLSPTDSSGGVGTAVAFTLIVDPPPAITINTTSPLQPSMVGASYSTSIALSGGLFPYAFSVSAGALPPGLTLDGANGSISGTPTTAGTFTPTIQVTDAGLNPAASKQFTIVIDPALLITTLVLPGGDAGQQYSQPVAAAGGSSSAPLTFGLTGICSLTSGCSNPPANLQIDPSTGVISTINPPTPEVDTFIVFVDDADGNEATMTYTITFADPVAVATGSLPGAARFSAYCQSLSAGGGTPGYTWSLSAGSLPTGVSLDSYGHLTGTPTVAGTYTFTVAATDIAGQTATHSYTVTIS